MKSVFLGGTAAETAESGGVPRGAAGVASAQRACVKNQFIVAGDDDDRGGGASCLREVHGERSSEELRVSRFSRDESDREARGESCAEVSGGRRVGRRRDGGAKPRVVAAGEGIPCPPCFSGHRADRAPGRLTNFGFDREVSNDPSQVSARPSDRSTDRRKSAVRGLRFSHSLALAGKTQNPVVERRFALLKQHRVT